MKRPLSVPERIWDLWLIHKETNAEGVNCSDVPEYIIPRPATEKALLDAECACVWSAVDRRFNDGAVRFVFDLIQDSFCGPVGGGALIPRAERKRRGLKIARLAKVLRGEIEQVLAMSAASWRFDDYAPLPEEFIHARLRAASAAKQPIDDSQEDQSSPSSHNWHWYEDNIFFDVLAVLEQGAIKWSESSPNIDDRSSNPLRLFFIRNMTSTFWHCFKSPMREHVAALARCLFDGPMDAATVAKLAPVNESAMPDGYASME